MKKLAILIIHGMGSQEPNHAEDFISHLKDYLSHHEPSVAIRACYWADILQTYQGNVVERINNNDHLFYKGAREWFISTFGDPPSYLAGFFKDQKPVYSDIHKRIYDSLSELEAKLDENSDKALIVLAHSLGSVIITNLIWDEQQLFKKGKEPIGKTPFQRTETLTSLITYGSNIPLFLPPVKEITCIRFPWDSLSSTLKPHAKWLNVFAPGDLLGYPLENLWDKNNPPTLEDKAMNVGPPLVCLTPLSHVYYETDHDFLQLVSNEVKRVLEVIK